MAFYFSAAGDLYFSSVSGNRESYRGRGSLKTLTPFVLFLIRKPGHTISGLQLGQYAKSLDPRPDRCGWCIVCCPSCGRLLTLGRNHTVQGNGKVTPSLVCPHKPCMFHDFVILKDWGVV